MAIIEYDEATKYLDVMAVERRPDFIVLAQFAEWIDGRRGEGTLSGALRALKRVQDKADGKREEQRERMRRYRARLRGPVA